MSRKKSVFESNAFYTVLAIAAGFVIGAVFLQVAGISPVIAYGKLLNSVFSKPKYLVWTLIYASPLIFTGLSVAFSFRTGVFNIGAEGQYVVGALAACSIGILLKLPVWIHIPLCILAAAAAGAVWSLLVGLLKVKRGIHEVLSFIMFNWIAFYLSNYVVNLKAIHSENGGEATRDIQETARILFPESLRDLLGCSSANWGFILAVLAAVLIWIVIEKTTLGYKLKAVGFNSNAALYAGINSEHSILTALGISGALAGLGGAVQILGMSGRLSQFAGQEGFGFEGITVALIGASSPIGCIFSGIFYGAMKYGGSKLSIVKAPSEVVDIIMGCVILFIAISGIFRGLFRKLVKKGGK
ncbi:MAG: ABC transporter permease [Lachnospiraceae bacterium]|nr:ABC transporter permease [Lachnospiraceae bacterium]